MELSPVLFWDTDVRNLDYEKHARYVMEKVIMLGTLEEWRQLQEYYGNDRIREEMKQSRVLDPRSLSFLSCIFDIPKTQFRCFTQIQSQSGHWTY